MFKFDGYSEKQKQNWSNSKRILLYENDETFLSFIEKSLKEINFKKKLYFGIISHDHAELINYFTGIDVAGYNCALSSDEVRKIKSSHGDEKIESLRGQRAFTFSDYLNIPFVILSPDVVELSPKNLNNNPALLFHKLIGNDYFTIVTGITNKHLDVFIQTSWITKKETLPRR